MIENINKLISVLALGTAFYKLKNRDECFEILDRFLELGGTLLDTGRHYGESEDVLGLWLELRRARDRVVLLTKGGHGDGFGVARKDFFVTIQSELTTSLEKLRTDHVDLYLLHRDSPSVPVSEVIDCLNAELNKGRVRSIGASNWEYDRVVSANDYARQRGLKGFSVVSNNISLAVPREPFYPGLVSVNREGEKWHQHTGIPLLVWSSQARGFFTGRFTPQAAASSGSAQDGFAKRMFEVYGSDENYERLRRATEMGKWKGDFSAVQIALASMPIRFSVLCWG